MLVLPPHAAVPALPPGVHGAQRAGAGPALLVRPDGYVAWAGSAATGTAAGNPGWQDAWRRWTGRAVDVQDPGPVPAA